ncbi:peptidoglycan-binding protein [Actinacidiphila glaucinigra]|uniref:peptidoglycan-binding domain-containing protein n=1 Tax=Actinacidiphila glaucinigra TaxID=235986 RepID=UPI0036A726AA
MEQTMAAPRTSHRAAPSRRPAQAIRRLLSWLRRHPLAIGVTVVAAITLVASAHQNAQGRADNTPQPVAVPTLDDCAMAECLPSSADVGADSEAADIDADSDAGPSLPETLPPAPQEAKTQGSGSGPRTWPLIKAGADGETVAAIQLLLAAHGYRTDADAVFGPATSELVTAYQRDHSLASDGIVGPDTWHALIINARAGDRGPAVQAIQRLLTAHNHSVTADGVFGQQTIKAVTAFQTDHQLAADGIVGPDTWSALINLAK